MLFEGDPHEIGIIRSIHRARQRDRVRLRGLALGAQAQCLVWIQKFKLNQIKFDVNFFNLNSNQIFII